MANITLSIPDWLYKLMKKYSAVNWSEVARRAIIKEILAIKAEEEGLNREELSLLMEIESIELPEERKVPISEEELRAKVKDRERRRLGKLREVGLRS
jgi:hypothetical protein